MNIFTIIQNLRRELNDVFWRNLWKQVASPLIDRSIIAYAQTHDASNIILKMKL
jgi:hypothetical protein